MLRALISRLFHGALQKRPRIGAGEPELRAFVSSVMTTDLQWARDATVATLRAAPYLLPWAFEFTPASSEDVEEGYLRHVREADFVVWLVKDTTSDPVENEIREALAADRRLWVFRFATSGQDDRTEALLREVGTRAKRTDVVGRGDLREALGLTLGDEIVRAVRNKPGMGRVARLEEMGRESRGRCVMRWQGAGVLRWQALELADDAGVGAPATEFIPTSQKPLVVLTGDIGAGKSLVAERMLQNAIGEFRQDSAAPLPIYLGAGATEQGLKETVIEQARGLGDPRIQPVMVVVDGADEVGKESGRKLLDEGRTLVTTWPGRETANPQHPSLTEFKLDFSDLSPHAVKEILDFTPAQELRFFQAFDVCKQLLRDLGVYPARGNRTEEQQALEIDELETGYPGMTLSQLIDVAGIFQHIISKNPDDPEPYNPIFRNNLPQVMQRVHAVKSDSEVSWRALLGKLWRLHRLQILDNPRAAAIDYAVMLQPGRVSIVDLSDTDSPQVNNLVIAQILRGVQRQQDENYQQAVIANRQPTPALVFIEEAHEFLSAQRIKDMPVLFQQVARIARRGRKRWLGLVFITQLPQHLPDEVIGLINNWVLHKINDSNVVNRLRRSIGGIDDALWSRLPGLAPGQAIVSFTSLARPLLVAIDPTPCKLQMVE